jgi:hypothetical protein
MVAVVKVAATNDDAHAMGSAPPPFRPSKPGSEAQLRFAGKGDRPQKLQVDKDTPPVIRSRFTIAPDTAGSRWLAAAGAILTELTGCRVAVVRGLPEAARPTGPASLDPPGFDAAVEANSASGSAS